MYFPNVKLLLLLIHCLLPHPNEGLTEEPSGKSDSGTVKQRKMSKKNTEEEPKARALTSTNSDRWQIQQRQHCTFNSRMRLSKLKWCLSVYNRLASDSVETELDVQLHCSSSLEVEPEKVVLRADSPPLASAFALSTSFEEDVLDLKWRQSIRALLCPPTPVLSPSFCCFGWVAFNLFVEFFFFFSCLFFFLFYILISRVSPFVGWDGCSGS